ASTKKKTIALFLFIHQPIKIITRINRQQMYQLIITRAFVFINRQAKKMAGYTCHLMHMVSVC
ncbi:MAG: hypothetical protein V7677_19815, partial [Motiliproteus sp.]